MVPVTLFQGCWVETVINIFHFFPPTLDEVLRLFRQYCEDWKQNELWVEAEECLSWCSECLERYTETKKICLQKDPQRYTKVEY